MDELTSSSINYDKLIPKRKLIVEIRGTNASGKTTTVKQFIGIHKNQELMEIEYLPNKTAHVVRFGNNMFAIGRYDKKISGVDLYASKEKVFRVIKLLLDNYNPNLIVLEGAIFGKTYKTTYDLALLVSKYNFRVFNIFLKRDIQNNLKLLEKRNNGGNYNIVTFMNAYKAINKLSQKCLNEKIYDTVVINADKVPYDKMWTLISDVVYT